MSRTPLGITVTRSLAGGRRVEVWDFDYWKRAGISPGPYVMVPIGRPPDPEALFDLGGAA